MDPVSFLTIAMQLAPLIISTGEEIVPFVTGVWNTLTQPGGPTQADFDALAAQEATIRAQIAANAASASATTS